MPRAASPNTIQPSTVQPTISAGLLLSVCSRLAACCSHLFSDAICDQYARARPREKQMGDSRPFDGLDSAASASLSLSLFLSLQPLSFFPLLSLMG